MSTLSFLVVGNASLTQHCAALTLARGHTISAVVTKDAQVRSWAMAQGLKVVAQTGGWPQVLAGERVDWLLSVANLAMIPSDGLALATAGAVNFHDGPLPRYAGLNAPVWAILNGEPRHGISWHLVDDGIDTGDVLEQRMFDLVAEETALTLNSRCFEAALESFPDVLAQLESGHLRRKPQDLSQRSLYLRADRPAAMGCIDFTRPASEIVRLVRALDHGNYWNPVATAKLVTADQVLNVGRADVASGQGTIGQVLQATANGLEVACGEGAVWLADLTCAAGRAVESLSIKDTTFPPLAPDLVDDLTRTGQLVARREASVRKALVALEPVVVPGPVLRNQASEWRALPFDLPQSLSAMATAALRICGQSAGDFALAAKPVPGFVGDWLPLRVDGRGTIAASVAQVQQRLAGQADPGFALDLLQRDPTLSGVVPPSIGLSDTSPVAGTSITLTPSTLYFDIARMPESNAHAFAARIVELADLALGDPEQPVQSLPRATKLELQQVLHEFNSMRAPYDTGLCVHQAFERQVRATPDEVALVCEAASLTFGQLDARANQLAQVLVADGAGPNVLVGLCLPRGIDMVVAALATLKSGAAYVPLDPSYPADRISFFISDSACPIIVTDGIRARSLQADKAKLICVDQDARIDLAATIPPLTAVRSNNLAYVIYTSGSTGRPKGVMVEHRNVINFFAGMDRRLGADRGVWLAVTSLSFDISVQELFWTLTRGFKLVLMSEANRALASSGPIKSGQGMAFSLYYWGNDDTAGADKYRLLLEGARFADENGFTAVWTPERHFHAFGGPYPNPAVTGAAVAAVTKNIGVRAGSSVSPLHHPIRLAEEWAVVDNLCGGRAGLALASGWHPDDFLLRPENTPPHNRAALFASVTQLRRLWRGEALEFPRADGSMKAVTSQPRPISKEVELWITTAGNPDTWAEAGRLGAHLLTHLLGQSIAEVAEKIGVYHQALSEAGHDPKQFRVTLMLHSYVAETRDAAREVARGPMKSYLRAAASLIKSYAWAFPAFKRPKGVTKPADIDIESLAPDELDAILDHAFERYFEESGLFGTVEDALARVDQLKRIGVDEVACLIDYGIAPDVVLQGLRPLSEVLRRANAPAEVAAGDHSIAAEIVRHGVTHLQCTPSMARMIVENDISSQALKRLHVMLLGGEALPETLVANIAKATEARLLNMYGPTETTIWSASDDVTVGQPIRLGKPLANQQIYVLDSELTPVPAGMAGEIWIGGDGVTRGYWQQPELTAERFMNDRFVLDDVACIWGARMYRTGDIGRWQTDGRLEFLGRSDTQIKLRGYRIELGEIESVLAAQPGVRQAVVLAREDVPGDPRLVAYVSGKAREADLRAAVDAALPDHMRPVHYVEQETFPQTPNQKIDRNALLPPRRMVSLPERDDVPQSDMETRIAALWCKVLGIDTVMPKDNFFGLGGHSLLAVQLHRDMRAALALPTLSITDIFRFPTLQAIAAHLSPKPVLQVVLPEATKDLRQDLMARRRAMRTASGNE